MEIPTFTWLALFLGIALCLNLVLTAKLTSKESPNSKNLHGSRVSRAVRKPGFFRTLFSVVYEQWADGQDTLNYVRNTLNENIIDDSTSPSPTTSTTVKDNLNTSTTEAPFRLTRSEVNRLINRNVKGLIRLYNLELSDALTTSYRNNANFRKNVSAEISKYL